MQKLATVLCVLAAVAYDVHGKSIQRRNTKTLKTGTTWSLQAWGYEDELKGEMVDVDLSTTTEDEIKKLSDAGHTVICYYSAGTAESWRPDYLELMDYSSGKSKYDDEWWLDLTEWKGFAPSMAARMANAAEKGCHGVEADNFDCYGYGDDCKQGYSVSELLVLEKEYFKWSADTAHNLGLLFGLKNALDMIDDLFDVIDFGINESCSLYQEWNECGHYQKFAKANKAVFGVEWQGNGECAEKYNNGIMGKYKKSGAEQWKNC
ncbi:hypothetical protein SARC_09113 [Sphaeroforma arctica JP610]|uniref:Glycoside-hydrolase family GH114 TIM-barrel domain-containing protein n=1 Tax=Sphaeroforma arctica JP610 TaxID=667725 RepID=A0A0L0FPM2_9EUKA|nr:hypothetical protein SARC_09113 [Sphaeroforma arctica JP610]KNC78461.1 hypothetical protein SARC_09113 [Sphaeroforma arctica JP610]|eukprot:XP_014152363.1 hypothetical protein SARC_09113 [Sphaeroforma arctica JP610]